jgi:hypothetical protein
MIAYWAFVALAFAIFLAYLVVFARRAAMEFRADGEQSHADHKAWVEAERQKNDEFLRTMRERKDAFDRQSDEANSRYRERLDAHNRRILENERKHQTLREAQRQRMAELDARLIAAGIDPQTIDASFDDEEAAAPPAR